MTATAFFVTLGCAAIGFADDYLKIVRRSHHGLIPRYKMGGQVLVALGVGLALLWLSEQNPPLYNTRFLSFATHYGYRPQACRPRRPGRAVALTGERRVRVPLLTLLRAPFVAEVRRPSHRSDPPRSFLRIP